VEGNEEADIVAKQV